jgi:iron complex outermembrane receptor protein
MQQFIVQGGYASSLLAAATAKQDNDGITEDLAPEDLGKLPTVSVADALATLPGVAAQRTNGRDQLISLRGLGPDFQVGTLDGVEQATTNDNRAVEYDQYPASLVGGVTIYKTGQANLVGGIGGTIDIESISPLAVDHPVLEGQFQYDWTKFPALTPGVKAYGVGGNVSFIDQFANNTEGVYVAVDHTENPFHGKEFQAWGYPTDGAGNLVLGGMEDWATAELLTRDSAIAVLESKPSSFVHSKAEIYWTKFYDNQALRGMQVPMAEYSSAELQPGYTVTDGAITSYTLKNVQPVLESLTALRHDHLYGGVWRLDFGDPDTQWPLHVLMGYSQVHRSDEDLESYAGLGFNGGATDADTFQVNQPIGGVPVVVSQTNYANPALFTLTDPQGWGTGTFPTTGQEGYLKFFTENDIVDSIKVNTVHPLGWGFLKDVDLGFSVTQRFKDQAQEPTGYLVNSDGKPQDPLPPLLGTSDLGFIGNLHPIAWNGEALASNGTYTFLPNPNPGTFLGDAFQVNESILHPYVQLDLAGTLGDMPWAGNVGGQVAMADQSSKGFGGLGESAPRVDGNSSYANFLPALNLLLHATPHDIVRFSAGIQQARPPMYQMRAGSDITYNTTDAAAGSGFSPWGGTVGNPNLRPWQSDSLDLSLEHYFNGGSYVAIAGYDKYLQTYVYQQPTVYNFTGLPYTSATPPWTEQGIIEEFQNGAGGHLSGLEGTVQLTSDLLTNGAFRGFGVQLNGTLTHSAIQPWGPGNGDQPLDNLSKKVGNLTLYYENHGFSARVNFNYRGATREYITTFGKPNVAGAGTPNDGYAQEQPEHTINAQISYSFRNGWFKGITMYLEGTNLNNEPLITFNNGDARQLINWQEYGASYKAIISYKY